MMMSSTLTCTLLPGSDGDWQVAAPRRAKAKAHAAAAAAAATATADPRPPPPPAAAAARRCFACGALAFVTVACSSGSGGEKDAEECARCGYWEAPPRAAPRRAVVAAFARGASSRTPSPPLPYDAQNDDPALALALARSCADAPLDFGHMPPLRVAAAAAQGGQRICSGARGHSASPPSTAAPSCLACSPARRCAAHSRLAPARLAPRRVPEGVPQAARQPLRELVLQTRRKDDDKGSCSKAGGASSSYCVPRLDASERARVHAAAAAAAAVEDATRAAPLSVAAVRRALGGDAAKPPLAQRLDTAWHVEAAEPRSRARAMAAAGWARCGSGRSDGHPRWERTLQAGRLAGVRQVLCFSSTTSDALHAWHNQSGDLARADRVARGER
jgi:hypothetical protein